MPYFFRAVAIDYDGTLTETARPDDDALAAIAEVRADGRKVNLCTGRILCAGAPSRRGSATSSGTSRWRHGCAASSAGTRRRSRPTWRSAGTRCCARSRSGMAARNSTQGTGMIAAEHERRDPRRGVGHCTAESTGACGRRDHRGWARAPRGHGDGGLHLNAGRRLAPPLNGREAPGRSQPGPCDPGLRTGG